MPNARTVLYGSGAGDETAPHSEVTEGASPKGKRCESCGQQFSATDARFCPFDGEPLAEAEWDATTDALLGTVVDSRYEVLSVLGEGGMGIVYRVRHKTLERPLALKALRRDLSKDDDLPIRFIQEAKAAAAVEHPNVVQITDFGTLPTGQPYFVMELLEGDALSSLIRSKGTLPPTRAIGVAIQVAEALSAAHAAGVVHRDLKPDNVNVRRVGHHDIVKVLDFGLAKLAGASRLTRAGMVFGTPHYMSPEQAAGEPSDHRVDIYALGVMLFEMLTGRLPFEADTFTGVLAMHMYMEPPSPSGIVGVPLGGVEDIVKKCMAKQPSERYATMSDLLSDLDRAGAMLSVPPEPSSRRRFEEPTSGEISLAVEPTARRLGGRATWLVAAGFGALGALVAGLLLVGREGEPGAASGAASAAALVTPPSVAAPPAAAPLPEPEPAASAVPPEPPPASSVLRPQPKPSATFGVKGPPPTGRGKPIRPKSGEIIDPWGR